MTRRQKNIRQYFFREMIASYDARVCKAGKGPMVLTYTKAREFWRIATNGALLAQRRSVMKWFTTSSGRIELRLTKAQAEQGSHQGRCDDDIDDLRRIPAISRQLDNIDAALLRDELREYGAWDDDELADRDQNISRILWLACSDIVDQSR